jgi:hypothetical protein
MEHLIAALAGGAVSLWFTGSRLRRESSRPAPLRTAAGARPVGAVELLLADAREAAASAEARRRADRAVARLDAMIRAMDAERRPQAR